MRLGLAARAGLCLLERVDVGGDFLLLLGQLFGLLLRALEVALATPALIAFELLLRLAQPVERLVRLRAAVLRSVGGRAPHRVGRVLQLLHRVVQLLPLLLVTRELLELPRGLFRFIRERPLRRAGSARAVLARLRHPALPLHFLLLPARQLLQFLDELIDLLIAALLFGALLHLVLVRELVQFELERSARSSASALC